MGSGWTIEQKICIFDCGGHRTLFDLGRVLRLPTNPHPTPTTCSTFAGTSPTCGEWSVAMNTEIWIISISALALLVSVVSVAITIYRTAPSTMLDQEQIAAMRIVASRTMVVWEQLQMISNAAVMGNTTYSQLLPSYQRNAFRLEEALDKAIGIGLFSTLIGDRKHALILYVVFVQSLHHVATVKEPNKQPPKVWTNEHYAMGLVRLLDIMRKFDPPLIPQSAYDDIDLKKLEQFIEKAYTYRGS